MARKNTDTPETANPFAGYVEFRDRAEDEKRSDYARSLWNHARPQFPEATEGSLHRFLAPRAGYKSHGSFYAALPGHSGNGTGKGTGARTKEGLQEKVTKLTIKISELQTECEGLEAKIASWDADHAEDVAKQAAKKEKGKESTLNFLNSLTAEERQAFMESFNRAQGG
jgi:hypothetical protein